MTTTATFAQFEAIDMRVGKIVAVEESLAKKPTYRFTVDFGPAIGVKRSCAALVAYDREELVGRLVIAVVNFAPKRMGPELSEVLILGLPAADGSVVHLQPERDVPLGGRVY